MFKTKIRDLSIALFATCAMFLMSYLEPNQAISHSFNGIGYLGLISIVGVSISLIKDYLASPQKRIPRKMKYSFTFPHPNLDTDFIYAR